MVSVDFEQEWGHVPEVHVPVPWRRLRLVVMDLLLTTAWVIIDGIRGGQTYLLLPKVGLTPSELFDFLKELGDGGFELFVLAFDDRLVRVHDLDVGLGLMVIQVADTDGLDAEGNDSPADA